MLHYHPSSYLFSKLQYEPLDLVIISRLDLMKAPRKPRKKEASARTLWFSALSEI
jgi:hypothetical protein